MNSNISFFQVCNDTVPSSGHETCRITDHFILRCLENFGDKACKETCREAE